MPPQTAGLLRIYLEEPLSFAPPPEEEGQGVGPAPGRTEACVPCSVVAARHSLDLEQRKKLPALRVTRAWGS